MWTMVCWAACCHYERQVSVSLCFCRCMSLQLHFQLFQCQRSSCSDINEQRAQKRAWQKSLNMDIQKIMLELMVNIFRSGGICGNIFFGDPVSAMRTVCGGSYTVGKDKSSPFYLYSPWSQLQSQQ